MQTNTAKFTGKPMEVAPAKTVSMKKPQRSILQSLMPAFAVFGVGAILCALIAQPAAAELNLTFVGTLFTTLFDALTSVMPSLETFMDAGFPLLIKIIIYVAIIGMIGLLLYFMKEVVEKIVKMIGF